MIPYTIDRRPDTGVTNVTMGIWLFLASEVMLFGALFSAYTLLRTSADAWPSGRAMLHTGIASVNTVVLLGVMVQAHRASKQQRMQPLAVGAMLAVVFLVLKGLEYRSELAAGWRPSTSTFFAMYFTLTGLHALHVLAGAGANVWALVASVRAGAGMTAGRLRALLLYWRLVDLVWLVIFGVMYLT